MADKFRAVVYPFVLILGAVIFLATGIYSGYELAVYRNVQWGWSCHSMAVNTYESALRRLQVKDFENVRIVLEKNIDFHVFLMQGHPDILSERTADSVQDSLIRVKSYREQYPWSGSTPELNATVAKVLSELPKSK